MNNEENVNNEPQSSIQRDDEFYDNTRVSSYKGCPRHYFLRHALGWRSEGTAAPLVFGLSWHEAQDVIWEHYKNLPLPELIQLARAAFEQKWVEEGFPEEMDLETINRLGARTPMVAGEMLLNYAQTRATVLKECELLAVEAPFAVPLPREHTWYVGRLDKVIRWNGQTLVIEHKTTTEYKIDGGFRETYIQGWSMDSQTKGYQYGGNLYYGELDGVWVDAALVHKKVHDKFKFIPVSHQLPILNEWIDDAIEWISRIERDADKWNAVGSLETTNEFGRVFPKNEKECYGKFGACTFVDICRSNPRPDLLDAPPAGFIEERWEPFNILNLQRLIKDA